MARTPKVDGLTANPPPPAEWVEMSHEGVEATQRCHPRAVAHWEARGWERVRSAAAAEPGTEPAAAPPRKSVASPTGTES